MDIKPSHNRRIFISIIGILLLSLILYFGVIRSRDTVMIPEKQNTQNTDIAAECTAKIQEQKAYLASENTLALSKEFTFDKYPVQKVTIDYLAPLDASSSRSASAFRTKLTEALEKTGTNFAGHYAIVSVGMTGWGDNYWIIDRTTGKAYEFPYKAVHLDFNRNSTLIIMDSKLSIEADLATLSNPLDACAHMGGPLRLVDLRPTYLEWNLAEKGLVILDDSNPPLNTFWDDYFK